jgi:hypothetical protein
MSSKRETETTHSDTMQLTVRTGDEVSDVFVLDSRGRLIERGQGPHATFDLERGIYRVKVRCGAEYHERAAALLESPGHEVRFDATPIASPVPVEGSIWSNASHLAAAVRISGTTAGQPRHTSSIFVMVRDWRRDSSRESRRPRESGPAEGLTLHRTGSADSTPVADIGALAERGPVGLESRDAWAAFSIDVVPGFYELRLALPDGGTTCQTIVVPPGWHVQYFALTRPCSATHGSEPSSGVREWRADLAGAALLLGRQRKFTPNADSNRLSELGRMALAARSGASTTSSRYPLLGTSLRNRLLHAKFDDPMLGIYAAHLLLLEQTPDVQLLKTAVRNLRRLFGAEHPDVAALTLAAEPEAQATVVAHPPMLRRSWALVIEASLDQAHVLAGDLESVSPSQTWAEGPWLLRHHPTSTQADLDELGLSQFQRALADQIEAMTEGPPRNAPKAMSSRSGGASSGITSRTVVIDPDRERVLARQFSLPRQQLERAVADVARKLPDMSIAFDRSSPRKP